MKLSVQGYTTIVCTCLCMCVSIYVFHAITILATNEQNCTELELKSTKKKDPQKYNSILILQRRNMTRPS